jgi:hypothetical protein
MILKMNFNFNFIRIASRARPRQRVRSLALVIYVTEGQLGKVLDATEKTLRGFKLRE